MLSLIYRYEEVKKLGHHQARCFVKLSELAQGRSDCVVTEEPWEVQVPEPMPAEMRFEMERFIDWSRQYA